MCSNWTVLLVFLSVLTQCHAVYSMKTNLENGSLPTRLRFWGVRGSIPTPGPSTVNFGGNTACVEIRSGEEVIVLDAGTGIRPLGSKLAAEFKGQALNLTLLISHTHWDHIQGFPFFAPAYNPKNKLRVLGYEGAQRGLEATLSSQMETPYFPITMSQMPGNIAVQELKEASFQIGNVAVESTFLNHPGVCVGYRLTTNAGSIAYLPDHEPFHRFQAHPKTGKPRESDPDDPCVQESEERLLEFVRGADVLILDSQYDETEYKQHVGWGHSCADDSVVLAVRAQVKQLFLFHHDPTHDDERVARITHRAGELARQLGSSVNVQAAREGLELKLVPAAVEAPL